LAARTDCANEQRLAAMDLFLMPVRNPDGRDAITRQSAWGFDHNRDFGTRNQVENRVFLPELNKYPGLFYVDAHQQASGYFFPPNEDPVHHEISNFSLGFIQDKIGPELQAAFNDQSSEYLNYNRYDLFAPVFGDSVPSLLSGAAGMTYEKGRDEPYGKQVYDHYRALDATVNVTVRDKVELLRGWTRQWSEAVEQGAGCDLQPNKLVSPLRETIEQQPAYEVCGYFFPPDAHEGDLARLLGELREVGVDVYRLDTDVNAAGVRLYGRPAETRVLPRGTFWIPLAQGQKHWIQTVLGEDPFIPFKYFYDVVTWSYPLQRGLAGSGFTEQPLPLGIGLTKVSDLRLGGVETGSAGTPVAAFDTDSAQGMALAVELLDAGATVSRAVEAFGPYESGAALVERASIPAGFDLAARAAARNTPVAGLGAYPAVGRQALVRPKVGIYAPAPPAGLRWPGGSTPGYCNTASFCLPAFVLLDKLKLPRSMVEPITPAELVAGKLDSSYTAFINPGTDIGGTGVAPLQTWVNQGGRYLGINANGLTTARNAGFTAMDTSPAPAGLITPGSTYDAAFTITNPVAWGFDDGGWLYRNASNNPLFDDASRGTGTSVVRYGGSAATTPVRTYGYEENSRNVLAGRSAVVDQAFGAGRAVLFGFDPFFRAWKDQDDRLVLNAITYPTGSVVAGPRSTGSADTGGSGGSSEPGALRTPAGATEPAARPLPRAKLPAVRSRPAPAAPRGANDVLIRVARRHGTKLRRAVRQARLPRSVRRHVRYRTTRRSVTLVVRGARTARNDHDRKTWTTRILSRLERQKVRPQMAQL
jgi:hypothetical protein